MKTEVLDSRSAVSFGIGVFAGASGVSIPVAAAFVIAFEGVLMADKDGKEGFFDASVARSNANRLGDICSTIIGITMGQYIRHRRIEQLEKLSASTGGYYVSH